MGVRTAGWERPWSSDDERGGRRELSRGGEGKATADEGGLLSVA
jgi:hypothetical protein